MRGCAPADDACTEIIRETQNTLPTDDEES